MAEEDPKTADEIKRMYDPSSWTSPTFNMSRVPPEERLAFFLNLWNSQIRSDFRVEGKTDRQIMKEMREWMDTHPDEEDLPDDIKKKVLLALKDTTKTGQTLTVKSGMFDGGNYNRFQGYLSRAHEHYGDPSTKAAEQAAAAKKEKNMAMLYNNMATRGLLKTAEIGVFEVPLKRWDAFWGALCDGKINSIEALSDEVMSQIVFMPLNLVDDALNLMTEAINKWAESLDKKKPEELVKEALEQLNKQGIDPKVLNDLVQAFQMVSQGKEQVQALQGLRPMWFNNVAKYLKENKPRVYAANPAFAGKLDDLTNADDDTKKHVSNLMKQYAGAAGATYEDFYNYVMNSKLPQEFKNKFKASVEEFKAHQREEGREEETIIPADGKPVDGKPAEETIIPADGKPADGKPAEETIIPADGKPADGKPAEDKPETEIRPTNTADKPETEVRPTNTADKPETEVRPTNTADKPETEVQPTNTADKPQTEVRPTNTADKPETEVRPTNTADKPETEVRPTNTADKPQTEVRPTNTADKPETEVRPTNTADKPQAAPQPEAAVQSLNQEAAGGTPAGSPRPKKDNNTTATLERNDQPKPPKVTENNISQRHILDDYEAGHVEQTFETDPKQKDDAFYSPHRLYVDDQDCRWLVNPDRGEGIYIPINKEDGSYIRIGGHLKNDGSFEFNNIFLAFVDPKKNAENSSVIGIIQRDVRPESKVVVFDPPGHFHTVGVSSKELWGNDAKPMIAFMDDFNRSFGQSFANFVKIANLEQEKYDLEYRISKGEKDLKASEEYEQERATYDNFYIDARKELDAKLQPLIEASDDKTLSQKINAILAIPSYHASTHAQEQLLHKEISSDQLKDHEESAFLQSMARPNEHPTASQVLGTPERPNRGFLRTKLPHTLRDVTTKAQLFADPNAVIIPGQPIPNTPCDFTVDQAHTIIRDYNDRSQETITASKSWYSLKICPDTKKPGNCTVLNISAENILGQEARQFQYQDGKPISCRVIQDTGGFVDYPVKQVNGRPVPDKDKPQNHGQLAPEERAKYTALFKEANEHMQHRSIVADHWTLFSQYYQIEQQKQSDYAVWKEAHPESTAMPNADEQAKLIETLPKEVRPIIQDYFAKIDNHSKQPYPSIATYTVSSALHFSSHAETYKKRLEELKQQLAEFGKPENLSISSEFKQKLVQISSVKTFEELKTRVGNLAQQETPTPTPSQQQEKPKEELHEQVQPEPIPEEKTTESQENMGSNGQSPVWQMTTKGIPYVDIPDPKDKNSVLRVFGSQDNSPYIAKITNGKTKTVASCLITRSRIYTSDEPVKISNDADQSSYSLQNSTRQLMFNTPEEQGAIDQITQQLEAYSQHCKADPNYAKTQPNINIDPALQQKLFKFAEAMELYVAGTRQMCNGDGIRHSHLAENQRTVHSTEHPYTHDILTATSMSVLPDGVNRTEKITNDPVASQSFSEISFSDNISFPDNRKIFRLTDALANQEGTLSITKDAKEGHLRIIRPGSNKVTDFEIKDGLILAQTDFEPSSKRSIKRTLKEPCPLRDVKTDYDLQQVIYQATMAEKDEKETTTPLTNEQISQLSQEIFATDRNIALVEKNSTRMVKQDLEHLDETVKRLPPTASRKNEVGFSEFCQESRIDKDSGGISKTTYYTDVKNGIAMNHVISHRPNGITEQQSDLLDLNTDAKYSLNTKGNAGLLICVKDNLIESYKIHEGKIIACEQSRPQDKEKTVVKIDPPVAFSEIQGSVLPQTFNTLREVTSKQPAAQKQKSSLNSDEIKRDSELISTVQQEKQDLNGNITKAVQLEREKKSVKQVSTRRPAGRE